MIDYVVRSFLTCVFVVFFIFLIVQFPIDFEWELSENIETGIGFLLLILPIVLGWILSGKIVESETYDYFLTEVIYTPNNTQLKFIMTPTLIICATSFVYCNYYDPNKFESAIGWMFFGSLGYGLLTIKFWFIGGLLGANSPHYNDTVKLNLSSLWALMAPMSVSLAVWSEQYFLGILQICAMVAIRIVFFFRTVKTGISID
jgi:hypothetical protein